MNPRVVILGAGGYTAGLIRQRLSLGGAPLVLASRRADEAAGILALDIKDAARVNALVRAGDIVVNCIGPFNLYSCGLLEQLAAMGVRYLDISGEQSFVSHSYKAVDALAKKHGSLILHAVAFESFFAVMLAALACEKGKAYADISSYYWFENGSPSPGTALTMRLAGHWDTDIYENGAWVPKAPKAVSKPFALEGHAGLSQAIFVPYPEVEFFPRMFNTKNAGSYFAVTEAEAQIFGASSEGVKRDIDEVLKKHQKRAQAGPTAEERAAQGVGVAVVVTPEAGTPVTRFVTGVDPYGLTAAIIAWCCDELLKGPAPLSGVLSPSEVFSAEAFMNHVKAMPEFKMVSHP